MTQTRHDLFRAIPPVDELLSHPDFAAWRSEFPHFPWTRFVRTLIDRLRDADVATPPEADRAAVTRSSRCLRCCAARKRR
jgi:hypothetical protein